MPEAVYVRKEGIVERRIAGEVFLVPVTGKLADMRNIYSLSPVAEQIWVRLDGFRTFDGIVKELLDVYEGDPGCIEADAREFVESLETAGLAFAQR